MPFLIRVDWTALIYIAAAVLPAIFFMIFVYKKDRADKEPPLLLLFLVALGIVSGLVAIVLEGLGEGVLKFFIGEDNPYYQIFFAFLVVAAVEEGGKYFMLVKATWKSRHFNYTFDGIVYSVFVSLGFALFENILYVFEYGLSVALSRALLSIPAHMGFAVIMGVFYGNAKKHDARLKTFATKFNAVLAYIGAVFLHGFYDACLMIGTVNSTLVFAVFVVITDIAVFLIINQRSKKDKKI